MGVLEMPGAAAFTVRVTGMVWGVLLAPVAAMVILAVWVPTASPEVA